MRASSFLVAIGVGLGSASVGYAGQQQVYEPGDGVTAPVVEKEVKPAYTPAARAALVEGVITLECVVRADGTVGEARVVKPLHPSLNEEALRALADWRFKPGMKDGKPVPVRVEVEMTFSLRESEERRPGPAVGSPEVFIPGEGVTAPKVLREVKPNYTAAAMRDGVQGLVKMKCVVLPDGTVGDVKVTQHLYPDLDEAAVRTLQKWTFTPGTKEGVAVPVQVEVDMSFTLGRRR
jgi:TonB family protein